MSKQSTITYPTKATLHVQQKKQLVSSYYMFESRRHIQIPNHSASLPPPLPLLPLPLPLLLPLSLPLPLPLPVALALVLALALHI